MSTQAPFRTTPEIQTWVALLRAHATSIRRFNAELVGEHGLTLNDYEVLLRLSRAEGRRLRRVDLAEQVLLTPSGITRLLEGLEAEGLVERESCPSDLRVTYARLTENGAQRLQAASCAHVASIKALFEEHLDENEITALADTLDKLPGVAGTDSACSAG